VEIISVPRSEPLLAIVGVLFRNVDLAANGIGSADAVGATALGHGVTKSDHARAAGNPIFGINSAGKFPRGGTVGKGEACRHSSSAPRCPHNRM
jgi:hypothetical protein